VPVVVTDWPNGEQQVWALLTRYCAIVSALAAGAAPKSAIATAAGASSRISDGATCPPTARTQLDTTPHTCIDNLQFYNAITALRNHDWQGRAGISNC
jgi:hypothetical protein